MDKPLCRSCDKPLPDKYVKVPQKIIVPPEQTAALWAKRKPGDMFYEPHDEPLRFDLYCPECWDAILRAEVKAAQVKMEAA